MFEIRHPEEWSFAKISVTNSKDGKTYTTTTTPNREASIEIYENAEYWVDAKIRVNENTTNVFDTIKINALPPESNRLNVIDIPEKQLALIALIIGVVGVIGIIKRN